MHGVWYHYSMVLTDIASLCMLIFAFRLASNRFIQYNITVISFLKIVAVRTDVACLCMLIFAFRYASNA